MLEQRATPAPALIDEAARRLMATASVRGMAVAVIDGGDIVHVSAYGARNVERGLPLNPDTVMYGASLTKTAFAYLVLQLVDEGRLDLDRSIAEDLPQPLPAYSPFADLADDPRWRALTPRLLLEHAGGFANFRWLEPDGKLRFHFRPGERYAYSGEGISVLQLAVEKGLGLEVGAEMQHRIFDRLRMSRTGMTWRPDFAEDVADGYADDGSVVPHDRRTRVRAAGSMDTTISDQARLWAAIVTGDLLSPERRAAWVRPGLAIRSARQFPTLLPDTDPRAESIRLAAGLGVVTFQDASGPMWFKGGHNDGTGNMVVCQEARRRCVVLLANSVRAERIYPELVRFILGDTAMPWWWEYGEHG